MFALVDALFLALRSRDTKHAGKVYRDLVAARPKDPEVLHTLGIAAFQLGLGDEAAAHIRQAIVLDPQHPGYLNNLGNILKSLGKQDEAKNSFTRALTLKPDLVEAHHNLGGIAQAENRQEDAIEHYRQAIKYKPDYAEAINNLGNALRELGRFQEAEIEYRRALSFRPAITPGILNNLGIALQEQGKLQEATETYRQAFQLDPDYSVAHSNYLIAAQYSPDYAQAALFQDHLLFGKHFARNHLSAAPAFNNVRDPLRPLRIGFVSGDFRNHPVGYFLEGVLAALNPQNTQAFLYPTSSKQDELTRRILKLNLPWRPLTGLSDEIAARIIRDDSIDILIDLSGHTAHNRLPMFAQRLAPIQATWLGYFATTGLPTMDYIFGDRYVTPETESSHFVERPWPLPESYFCFTPPADDLSVGELPAQANGYLTFGCFNNLAKMNDDVVELWAALLHATPNSRLLLKTKQLNDESVRQSVLRRFNTHGILPERLLLEGFSPRKELLASYNRVDIALDPFPYNGGTTSVEALWMGVPVLNLKGQRFLEHVGETILQTVGLPEWVAQDKTHYITSVRQFSEDLAPLAKLRQNLRQQLINSPLCDSARLAHNLEDALRQMWQVYCEKK